MTGSRLAALLDQATPGPWGASDEMLSKSALPFVAQLPEHVAQPPVATCQRQRDADLIALAPDMARLLVDMAAWIGRVNDSSEPDFNEQDSLLARFAALDEKAGAA